MRGGTFTAGTWIGWPIGLSPRARRNRHGTERREADIGSISACAEEPAPAGHGTGPGVVYLRVRGGTQSEAFRLSRLCGLSPRARRNHGGDFLSVISDRSISACAEEPRC
ncbi:Hypothetical protein GbCGDNIH6_7112 [Granulibacter bethesdensis]|nr:Hypothetical protein GbCGDNIH6_7112 [Granulibacter bethesdensis]